MDAREAEVFLTHLATSGRCRLRSGKSTLLFFIGRCLRLMSRGWQTSRRPAIDPHPVSSGAATATKKYCSGPWNGQCARRASPNRPHLAPQICHACASGGLRHPHGAEATGPYPRCNHPDPRPRPEPGCTGCGPSFGL